ncbi:MAG: response regulator [Candidatus Omnitrophica bacterium]|nr:response regulator [Candidatus Omnitrophota bacterium]
MKNVIVIDDDQGILSLFEKKLTASGYAVSTAMDGVEGLAKIRRERPDLVVIDVVMPKMDGFSVVREIRADDNLKAVPVIVLTAKGELGDLFRMEGVAAFFEKPFSCDELLAKIHQLIG